MHPHHPRHAAPAKPAPATPTTAQNTRSVCPDDIRLRAYRKWENAGKPNGDGIQFWLEAEKELMHAK